MKGFLVVAASLTLLLSGLLAWKLHAQRATDHAPGGTGLVEGVGWDLAAELTAPVAAVEVAEGEVVDAGTVLVRFQCDEAEARKAEAEAHLAAATAQADALAAQRKAAGRSHRAARASVAASRGQVAALDSERELTQREVERVHTLGEYAAPSRRDELETRATRLDHEISAARASRRRTALQAAAAGHQESAAEAQRRAASESVRAAAAALRRAELRTEDCRLVAPKRAVVEAVHYEVGELAKAGAVILRLVRLDPVEVTFYLPNAQLSALAPGHEATIVADAWPDREFTGEVTTVATEAEFTPRNVQTREERARLVYPVEVSVPNPEHALRPGMPVEVTLEASR